LVLLELIDEMRPNGFCDFFDFGFKQLVGYAAEVGRQFDLGFGEDETAAQAQSCGERTEL